MGKNGAESVTAQTATTADAPAEELMHDVMTDHLDILLAIIMKIREDPDFAASIYLDCPRLQYLLIQHPDLRPVFEDPKLVRVNFEEVYRKAGGVLPEDRPSRIMQILVAIVTHPLFKVLKFLLFIKKMMSCALGGGFGFLTSMFFADHAANAVTSTPDPDAPDADNANAENQVALNHAAEYMEGKQDLSCFHERENICTVSITYSVILLIDPAVQEKMNALLESNPDNLQEAIENDPELRALRDANPLCAELMQDPDTMRILIDPDNLRALAECPDLVEADFADPDWAPPDPPQTTFDDATAPPPEPATVMEGIDLDHDGEVDDDFEDANADADEEDDHFMLDDFEPDDDDDNGHGSSVRRMQSSKNSQSGSFFGSLREFVAGELIGSAAGGFDTSGLEDQFVGAANVADDNINQLDSISQLADSDAVGNLEDTVDKMEETYDGMSERDEPSAAVTGAAVAVGAVAGGAIGTALDRGGRGEEEEEEEEVAPTSRMAGMGGVGSFLRSSVMSIGAAAKEQLATALLGDDMGELAVEKLEERGEGKGKTK
jgi:hypothetical protein